MSSGKKKAKAAEDVFSPIFMEARTEELARRVPPKRFKHSLAVADTAGELAEAYGVDRAKARLAGLLHDWDKGYDDDAEIRRAEELGLDLDEELTAMPRVLHGLTAAEALKREFPAIPDDVISAIRLHTLAAKTMTDLDKVVYLADALEPHRRGEAVDRLRSLVGKVSLEELFLAVYAQWVGAMLERRQTVYSKTVDIWNAHLSAFRSGLC